MARYTDAKCRLCRQEQTKLFLKGTKCFSEKCPLDKRQTKPGAHGSSRSRLSGYGIQFREKQKVKRTYGLLEKPFRRFFAMASKEKGNTGVRLLQLLETRLDNVVYRLGFARSRAHAKQIISHGHVLVNGKKVNLNSYILNVGDMVSVKESSAKDEFLPTVEELGKLMNVPAWLERGKGFEGRVTQIPSRDMIDTGIREQLIVEFYSR